MIDRIRFHESDSELVIGIHNGFSRTFGDWGQRRGAPRSFPGISRYRQPYQPCGSPKVRENPFCSPITTTAEVGPYPSRHWLFWNAKDAFENTELCPLNETAHPWQPLVRLNARRNSNGTAVGCSASPAWSLSDQLGESRGAQPALPHEIKVTPIAHLAHQHAFGHGSDAFVLVVEEQVHPECIA
jgi:hypothetical protein